MGWEAQIKHLVCLKSWQRERFCSEVKTKIFSSLDEKVGDMWARIWRKTEKPWVHWDLLWAKERIDLLCWNLISICKATLPCFSAWRVLAGLLTYTPRSLFCMDLSVRIYFQQRNLARNCAIKAIEEKIKVMGNYFWNINKWHTTIKFMKIEQDHTD